MSDFATGVNYLLDTEPCTIREVRRKNGRDPETGRELTEARE